MHKIFVNFPPTQPYNQMLYVPAWRVLLTTQLQLNIQTTINTWGKKNNDNMKRKWSEKQRRIPTNNNYCLRVSTSWNINWPIGPRCLAILRAECGELSCIKEDANWRMESNFNPANVFKTSRSARNANAAWMRSCIANQLDARRWIVRIPSKWPVNAVQSVGEGWENF